MWKKEKKFIEKLIELTKFDKMRWDQMLDIHKADRQTLFVYWLQDDQPELEFKGHAIRGYGLGNETLLKEIRYQYERQDRNGYGPTAKKKQQESDRARSQEAEKRSKDFSDAANKFLEDEKKKKRK